MKWRAQVPTIDPSEAALLVMQGTIVIDVRESFEWRSGHICGATHIPLFKLRPETFIARREIVTVCRTGRRSAIAVRRLRAGGINARNLAGGMNAWRKAGHTICVDNGIGEGESGSLEDHKSSGEDLG
jgi:rhodanese-related sulfurtransferase